MPLDLLSVTFLIHERREMIVIILETSMAQLGTIHRASAMVPSYKKENPFLKYR